MRSEITQRQSKQRSYWYSCPRLLASSCILDLMSSYTRRREQQRDRQRKKGGKTTMTTTKIKEGNNRRKEWRTHSDLKFRSSHSLHFDCESFFIQGVRQCSSFDSEGSLLFLLSYFSWEASWEETQSSSSITFIPDVVFISFVSLTSSSSNWLLWVSRFLMPLRECPFILHHPWRDTQKGLCCVVEKVVHFSQKEMKWLWTRTQHEEWHVPLFCITFLSRDFLVSFCFFDCRASSSCEWCILTKY